MLTPLFAAVLLLSPFHGGIDDYASPDTLMAAELPELTVVATRHATDVQTVPARVTVIDRAAIEQVGATTLADVLESRSGAFVRQHGPTGLATLSLRGLGASQTAILLNGTRINDPQLGQLDLSLLPTAVLESVEVLHGAISPLYGSDGLAGAVNLRTRGPNDELSWRFSGETGAFGSHGASGMASGSVGSVRAMAAMEYRSTAGNFPFIDTSRLEPVEQERRNADREQLSALTSLEWKGDRREARLSALYTTSDRGLPGVVGTGGFGERQEDEALRLWTDAQQQFDWGTLRFGGLVQDKSIQYRNPAQQIDQTGRTLLSSVESEATAAISRNWLASAGLTGSYSRAAHPSLTDNAWQVQGGAFVLASGRTGRVHWYPALRVDGYRFPDGSHQNALNPRLGVNIAIPGLDGLRAKGNVARAFRAPTFNDRFWQPGGNPDLNVEQGVMADAGLLLDRHAHRAEVSLFTHHVTDQIVWQPQPSGYWSPRNVQQVRSRGVEASYRARVSLYSHVLLESGLHVTLTEAVDRSDPESRTFGKQLRYVPREEWKAHTTLTIGPVSLDTNFRYTGKRFLTADESQALDPHIVVDSQVRVRAVLSSVQLNLGLHLRNLFDTDYAIMRGQPMPPRHLHFRIGLESRP